MTLSERLKRLREKNDWTQEQTADRFEVPRSRYVHYEAGRHEPRGKAFLKRLEALERSPSVEPPTPPAPDPLEARLESMDRQLSEIRGILLGQRNPFTVQEPLGPVAPRTQRKNTVSRAKPLSPQ